jgi:hypothetical protein
LRPYGPTPEKYWPIRESSSQLFQAVAHPEVAAAVLELELYFGAVGGLLLSLTAVVGASVALAVADHRLRSTRFVQGSIAGLGAALSALDLFAILGQTVVLTAGAPAGILAFIAASSFGLMCIRARPHLSVDMRL